MGGTQQHRNEILLRRLLAKTTIQVLLPSLETAEHYARVFVQLKRAGTRATGISGASHSSCARIDIAPGAGLPAMRVEFCDHHIKASCSATNCASAG